MSRVKKCVRTALVASICLASVVFLGAGAPAVDNCQSTWGSLTKQASGEATVRPFVAGVRSGQHHCYDRIVVDLKGDGQGYRVAYVDQVIEDGRGEVVPLRGGAFLEVIAIAPAYDDEGNATYDPPVASEVVSVQGYQTLRQVALASSFEGTTQFGVGVRARLPFRVFSLEGPGEGSRIVIDIAHRW